MCWILLLLVFVFVFNFGDVFDRLSTFVDFLFILYLIDVLSLFYLFCFVFLTGNLSKKWSNTKPNVKKSFWTLKDTLRDGCKRSYVVCWAAWNSKRTSQPWSVRRKCVVSAASVRRTWPCDGAGSARTNIVRRATIAFTQKVLLWKILVYFYRISLCTSLFAQFILWLIPLGKLDLTLCLFCNFLFQGTRRQHGWEHIKQDVRAISTAKGSRGRMNVGGADEFNSNGEFLRKHFLNFIFERGSPGCLELVHLANICVLIQPFFIFI